MALSFGEMPMNRLVLIVVLAATTLANGGEWSYFRGPNGSARAVGNQPLPADIAPDKNVIWKTSLPPGHSSPIIWRDRIYLTGVRDKALLTIAIDRTSGKVLWESAAQYQQLERIHGIGSHAQGTPATDGQHIVSYFGSCGLQCYDPDGKLLWRLPLGPFKNDLGGGSSPIIAAGRVFLNQDHDLDSFLLAVDVHSGKILWRTDRSEFTVGYATPTIWEVDGKKQVVVAGTLRTAGYDADTGQELWTVLGLSRAVHMTPTVGPDSTLYVAGWTAGGDAATHFDVPTFDAMLAEHDKDKNGTLEKSEMPAGPLGDRFALIDRDKDGHVTRAEYDSMKKIFDGAVNRMYALKPGGRGDISKSHVLWNQGRHLAVVPSPLLYDDTIFLMRNGGLLATLDARTGKLVQEERLSGAGGDYYASPVGGDGKVYLASQKGDVTVVTADAHWKLLHKARFGEDIFATPALVDGRVYLRTAGHLYCFGR
jgi:outer membrane protein assembly factor BamB